MAETAYPALKVAHSYLAMIGASRGTAADYRNVHMSV
jgi:hypothetical protein